MEEQNKIEIYQSDDNHTIVEVKFETRNNLAFTKTNG